MPDFNWTDYFAAPRYFHRGGCWGVHTISTFADTGVREPGGYTWLGTEYAVLLVDGHHMPPVVPEVRCSSKGRAKQPGGTSVLHLFDLGKHRAGETTVADLKRAFGVPAAPAEEKPGDCPDCNGSGIWTCFTCDAEHDCEECDGMGIVMVFGDGADPVHLDIGGAIIDNRVAAPLIAGLPDGTVAVHRVFRGDEFVRIVFVGTGWQMTVMEMTNFTPESVIRVSLAEPVAVGE